MQVVLKTSKDVPSEKPEDAGKADPRTVPPSIPDDDNRALGVDSSVQRLEPKLK
jgi:hypothetical protein